MLALGAYRMNGEIALPALVGPYELLVRLGSGGMASVYLARLRGEAGFSRAYAVKLIHPWLAEQRELIDMLMDEARIASRLAHPNVVATIDLGRAGETYYLAMEYVDGVALDRLLERHPSYRPPELIVPIVIDALRGLQAAHELCDAEGKPLELVHRDVAPGNLLVSVDGTALIADFGVAKARARITKTNPGIVKGKAGYIAPEVVLGRHIDARADVFSMGVTLWNCLTGVTLFDTEHLASSLTALMRGDVPAPSQHGLKPPAIFDHAILSALRREPDHRHPSAADFADALADSLAVYGRPVEQARIGAWVNDTFKSELEALRELTAPETDFEVYDDGRADATRSMRRRGGNADGSGGYPQFTPRTEPSAAPPPAAVEARPRRSMRPFAIAALVLVLSMLIGAVSAYLLLGGGFTRLRQLSSHDGPAAAGERC